MKTIIVATDFSAASHNAAKYAVEMANALQARILLFNAYQVPLSIPESYVVVNPTEVKKAAEDYLLDEVVSLRKKSMYPIEILAAEGNATECIMHHAEKYTDCLLVVGMKGDGKKTRNVFGSTASGLARKSNVPLLIVPENAVFRTINKIALASDINFETDLSTIDALKEVGMSFNSKIYIVRVLKNNLNIVEELAYRSSRILSKLKPLEAEYKFPRSADVTKALQDFSEDYGIDLLTVIPQHHNLLERVFIKSETRQLIFHAYIPLLILPEKIKHSVKPSTSLQKQQS
jgi:nucleotide-binding universal stress UspA family protein